MCKVQYKDTSVGTSRWDRLTTAGGVYTSVGQQQHILYQIICDI